MTSIWTMALILPGTSRMVVIGVKDVMVFDIGVGEGYNKYRVFDIGVKCLDGKMT